MNRRTAEIVLVAAVAILVVSIAASTLNSTTSSGGLGLGGDNGTGIFPDVSMNVSGAADSPTLPREPILVLVVLGLLLSLWYLFENPKDAIALMVFAAVLVVVLFLLMWAFANLFGGAPGEGGGLIGGSGLIGDGSDGSRGESISVIAPHSIELIAVLVLGVVFVGVVLGVSGRGSDEPGEGSPVEDEAVDMGAIARTAGRAADRIENDAEVDNEVYRAWREMTDLLEVPDPETSTPREFAAAAVEAGMDPDDVDELTVLFEEVRYGAEEPTGEREERAVDALRRIESTYGEA